MKLPTLPEYDYSLVIRTDFSDDAAWNEVCQAIRAPQTEDEFQASVECIDDETCAGLTADALASVLPEDSQRSFVFLVDSETISRSDHPVLVVDLVSEPGRTFRVIPSQAWGVENNLRLANMDFADFADSADEDGVFRGFPRGPA
ncbi:MAG: hypothetical protein WCA07_12715 [Gloeobacterales cyanobacterium]